MKYLSKVVLVLFSALLFAGCAGKREAAFYVSRSGDDANPGTEAKPFATLERARDAARELRKTGKVPAGGVTICIRGGMYEITRTFSLTTEDAGTETAPLVIRPYPGEEVILIGGKPVTGFVPVEDPAVLARIDESCRSDVLMADLKAQGITEYGDLNPASGRRIELFYRHKFMTVARYPNEGWLTIATVPQTGEKRLNEGLDRDKSPVPRGRHYGRFSYDGNRPDRWAPSDDIWMHGYWTWDWADQYLRVDKIDRKKKEVYPTPPHHGYGYTKGQRYYFFNILEELDAPGEWYLDRANGIVYFLPPGDIGDSDVYLSIFEDEMISLEKVGYVTIRGIVFECTRGSAVEILEGTHNTVAGCTFRNLGRQAVNINGGSDNGVRSCDIYDVGAGGIDLHGGDYPTLTPARHFADNNHIHDYGIRLKTYEPAVEVTGVGNRVTHNLIHDAPHTGIFLVTSDVGNDHVIEFNELHSLAKETGDVGGIYLCARNYAFRGTVIRYNYIHHMLGPGLYGVMAVYLDDFTSGVTVYGNVFYKSGRSAFIGGGRDNVVENNIFIECDPSVHVDARGLGWASYYFASNLEQLRKFLEEVNYREPPHSVRYPENLTVLDDEPAVPKYNKILRNVSWGGRWLDLYDGLDFSTVTFKDNLIADPVICKWRKKDEKEFKEFASGNKEIVGELSGNTFFEGDPGFVDREHEQFQLKDDSPAYSLGFKRIPIEKIGLYVDEYRTSLPERK